MVDVTIYTTPTCGFCAMAKSLLARKNIPYTEIDVRDEMERDLMMKRANGRRSVPQIFVGNRHLGGCDDLHNLERRGELDPLLFAS